MHWKIKAAIQNTVSLLPSAASYAAYYWIQRRFGGFRNAIPDEHLLAAVKTWKHILAQQEQPVDARFFEVGTGWIPIVPMAFWLMGAKRTVTVDVNTYMKPELVLETLQYLGANQRHVERLFEGFLVPQRLESLLRAARNGRLSLPAFLDLCSIEYVSPGDAARTKLPARSIDFHTSYTVLEHIPGSVIAAILAEGNRIVRDDGLFIHMVDYSDHFSHSDPSISAINFLQYSDEQWARFAGNRYMYMNRLRHDDVVMLFESAGHRIVVAEADRDERAAEILDRRLLSLDRRFSAKSAEILALRGAWIVSRPPRPV